MRRNVKFLIVLVGLMAGLVLGTNTAMAADTVGAFEIDGNRPDSPAGGAIDWDTPPPSLTNFTDGTPDTQFGGGAKWDDQSTWGGCNTGSVQAKSNILNGQISFRTISGSQFVYVNFTREGNNGSANIDYEFNQGSTPSPCSALPLRTVGDIVIAFDQDGNDPPVARVLQWNGSGFTELPIGAKGVTWDAAVSGNRLFGEAALNLSAILGSPIECGEFASVHMDSRSAPAVNSNMSDRTQTQGLNLASCPNTNANKDVRNVTTNGSFDDTASASPGDVLEYRIQVSNTGTSDATGVVVTDDVAAGSTYVANSCTGGTSCSFTSPTVTWQVGTVTPGSPVTLTFQVTAGGPGTVTNLAVVDTADEDPKNSDQTTVTITGSPDTAADKDVRNVTTNGSFADTASASPGDTLEYQIVVSNGGNAPATGVTVTDDVAAGSTYVPNSCTGGTSCSFSAPTVSWDVGTIDAGDSVTLTFQVTLDPEFPSGTTQVKNTAVVDSDQEDPEPSDETTTDVDAEPDLSVVKSSNQTQVAAGGQITYQLVYSNNGDGHATGVAITEAIPTGTKFISCDPTCSQTGDPVSSVSWDIGDVDAGDGNTVTLVVEVLNNVGCQVCNTAKIASPDQDGPDADEEGGDPIDSNTLCINTNPGPNPAGANARGEATGVHVNVLNVLKTTLPKDGAGSDPPSVSSSQSGVGGNGRDKAVANVNLGTGGSILRASAIRTSTVSTVTQQPAKSGNLSVAETAGVNVLNGVVTADVVRAVAGAEATGDSTVGNSGPSGGSTFVNLKVLGKAVKANVAPNTVIDLPDSLFGSNSYVKLMEVTSSSTRPAPGQQQGGTYSTDTQVTAIRVRADNVVGLGKVDIIVSQAKAHADFPQTQLCEATRDQSVSGHAFTAFAVTNPPILPILHGYVQIPATGGFAHQQLTEVAINEPNYLLLAKAVETHSVGGFSATSSDATSYAAAADVCVLRTGPFSCLIQTGLVRSQATSKATASGATSSDIFTTLGTVVVAGAVIPINVPRNTVIPLAGLGFLVLNEQFCDNGGSVPSCSAGNSTGLTVRTLRLTVTVPSNPFGLAPGLQLIVNEAHSDAKFVP